MFVSVNWHIYYFRLKLSTFEIVDFNLLDDGDLDGDLDEGVGHSNFVC